MNDTVIALSCFIISLSLIIIYIKSRKYPFSYILILLAFCILFAGINRVTDQFRQIKSIDKIHTLVINSLPFMSLLTAIAFVVVAKNFKILTVKEYKQLVDNLTEEISNKEKSNNKLLNINKELEKRIEELVCKKVKGKWIKEQEEALENLKNLLRNTKK
jgi:hypothetical protein